jgi:hypothetical protein
MGWAWMGERVQRRSWIAMAAALAGATVMASHSWSAGSITGDLLALTTAIAFAGATVIVRRHRHLRMTAAAGLASVFSAIFAWRPARPLDVAPDDLALLALFGAAQLGLGLVMFMAGARLIPVAEASLIGVLESVLGPVWVWLALGETPAPPPSSAAPSSSPPSSFTPPSTCAAPRLSPRRYFYRDFLPGCAVQAERRPSEERWEFDRFPARPCALPPGYASCTSDAAGRDKAMSNIFYIIGVVVVIVAILGFLGLR